MDCLKHLKSGRFEVCRKDEVSTIRPFGYHLDEKQENIVIRILMTPHNMCFPHSPSLFS